MQWGCSEHSRCSRCWCKKVNSHSVLSKYGCWGLLPLVQKGQPMQWVTQWMQYAVDAVGVGAKRSTHTVYSANIGGGDHYL